MVKFLDLVSSGGASRARGTSPAFVCFGSPALALHLLGTGGTLDLRSGSPLRVIHCCLVTYFHLQVHFTIHWAAWSCGQPSFPKSSWVTLGKLLPLCPTPSLVKPLLSVFWPLDGKVLVKTFNCGCQENS